MENNEGSISPGDGAGDRAAARAGRHAAAVASGAASGGSADTPDVDAADWMSATLASIRDGVITVGPSGRITSVNAAAEEMTGWDSAAACGQELGAVFRLDGGAADDALAPANGTTVQQQVVGPSVRAVLTARDGVRRPVEYRRTAVNSPGGGAAGSVLTFSAVSAVPTDAVADAKAPGALSGAARQSERYQRFVVDSIPIKLFTARADGCLDFYNAPWMEYTGLAMDQITNWGWTQFVHPQDVDENVRCWQQAVETGRPIEFEHRFRRADGQYRWHFTRALPMRDDEQRVLMWVGTSTDVHALKLADAALRESEIRYRRLFQAAKDGILILDAHTGQITDANAFMCGMLGMDYGELLGKELYEIGMPKDVQENKAAFASMQRTGYLRHDHLPVHNRRGERVEVEFVANIYQEGDKLVAQCNVRDIAERNRMKRQIVEQSEAMAEQARRKDEFLAMLSHELRNPLAPIRAAVHLLKFHDRGSGNLIQQQAREIIERQVGNLTKLVSDLMEISRVVSGRIRLDLQAVDIKQAILHAVQTVGPVFEQHRHTVTVTACDEGVWAEADPTRLEEILVNLLGNAAKYTPDGGFIRVDCACIVQAGRRQVVVRVHDNGIGIDGELLTRVFDLFAQADRSLARSAGGLGIGLTLVHRLVEMHGGTVVASSEGHGKGSVFTVTLPLIEAPMVIESKPDDSDEGPGMPEATGAVRILMVDDNTDLVKMAASVLRLKGHIVRCEHTGPEGLAAAQQWGPDVVLLDIGLPGLDGYEIARRLRSTSVPTDAAPDGDAAAVGVAHRVRLIALTGYGRDTDINLAREAGFDGHLVKPCDFDELERMIAATTLRM